MIRKIAIIGLWFMGIGLACILIELLYVGIIVNHWKPVNVKPHLFGPILSCVGVAIEIVAIEIYKKRARVNNAVTKDIHLG